MWFLRSIFMDNRQKCLKSYLYNVRELSVYPRNQSGFKFQPSIVAAAVINLDIELGRYSCLGNNWFPPWNNLIVFTSENIFLLIDSFWLVICKIIATATNVSSLRLWHLFCSFFSFLSKKVFNNLGSSKTCLTLPPILECYKC